MKRKIVTVILTLAMASSLAACGKSDSTQTSTTASTKSTTEATQTEVSTVAASSVDFDGSGYTDTGDGTFYLAGPGGTTEDGSVLTLYEASDTLLDQIEIDTEGFNGNSLTYIYIDGMETDKQQLADSQSSLDLTEDALKEGTHKVELVQFENDDTTGTVTTYKTASYEVKSK